MGTLKSDFLGRGAERESRKGEVRGWSPGKEREKGRKEKEKEKKDRKRKKRRRRRKGMRKRGKEGREESAQLQPDTHTFSSKQTEVRLNCYFLLLMDHLARD